MGRPGRHLAEGTSEGCSAGDIDADTLVNIPVVGARTPVPRTTLDVMDPNPILRDFDAIQQFVASVRIGSRGPLLGLCDWDNATQPALKYWLDSSESSEYVLFVVEVRVPDRDSGVLSEYRCSGVVYIPSSPESVVRTVRKAVKDALLHELDENIVVDGRRPFDPHHPERFQRLKLWGK